MALLWLVLFWLYYQPCCIREIYSPYPPGLLSQQAQHNKHVMITSKRHVDVIITCLLRFVFVELLILGQSHDQYSAHDDVIKWKHFPRYWLFVRGIHRSPVNSPHKGQWRGALMFSLICARINGWVNKREAGDLRRHHAHYDVIVMLWRNAEGNGLHRLVPSHVYTQQCTNLLTNIIT